MTTTLVTGGVRCGKSRHAERLLLGSGPVTYVAPGHQPDSSDPGGPGGPEWAARIATHRARRPPSWTTLETVDVAEAIRAATGPLLVDCLGTWLARVIDDIGWGATDATTRLEGPVEDLVHAFAHASTDVVVVSNEVGWGVVPATASGRLFRDELGRLTGLVADVATRVHLVVAGRVLDLSATPRVGR